MTVLDNAKAHFKQVLANGLQNIHVPEWDADIYFKPAMSLAQEGRIVALTQKGEMVEALVETLITRALDAEGKPLFKRVDKDTLLREVEPNVITRVVQEMSEQQKQVEDNLGN